MKAFTKIFAIGIDYIKDLFKGEVEITEKVDGCVEVGTPILMSDLKYKPVESINVGDKIIGFDEELNRSKFRESVVTHTSIALKECVRISLANGTEVVATLDHPFVVRFLKKTSTGLSKRYINAGDIKEGMKIVDFGYWKEDDTYMGGYIAGQYDGEGSLVGKKDGKQWGALTYYQNKGKGADIIHSYLTEEHNFTVGRSERQRNSEWGVCQTLRINGGWSQWVKFLGIFRPQRLLTGFAEKILWGSPFNGIKDTEVILVQKVGLKKIVQLSTSTHTYIAKGLCSHNSQFGFGKEDGEIITRSKGKVQYQGTVDKMFQTAVDYVYSIADRIPDNTFFYAEYLETPHHNSLTYTRVPKNNLALFGVCDNTDKFVSNYEDLKVWADKLEIDVVPLLYKGEVENVEFIKELIDTESMLGGAKIEGIVVKNYAQQFLLGGQPMPLMAGKYVSEAFKEVHRGWGKEHTTKGGWELFKMGYRTEPRWDKAIQFLKENGELTNTPKDIPVVMKRVMEDITEEEGETIRQWLWKHQGQELLRLAVSGLPEYYKTKLLERGFENE